MLSKSHSIWISFEMVPEQLVPKKAYSLKICIGSLRQIAILMHAAVVAHEGNL
ncbi:hypothetical protein BC834DRAFT_880543 [Gloeopeniophorella convolvens]|nr:hypothetical protein BC834DRAFT_880543 [Gloeopeniophorella convolvens]